MLKDNMKNINKVLQTKTPIAIFLKNIKDGIKSAKASHEIMHEKFAIQPKLYIITSNRLQEHYPILTEMGRKHQYMG